MSSLVAADWRLFDAIYLINLADRPDRKRELIAELISVGLDPDGSNLTWIRAIRPVDRAEFPSVGARGCFMSHLDCLTRACVDGYRRILILEDDATFSRGRKADLKEALSDLTNEDWSLWYGGYVASTEVVSLNNPKLVRADPHMGIQTSHCIALQGKAIISLKAFLELILTRPAGHPEAGPMHIDGAYSTWRSLNPGAAVLISTPQLCFQRASSSDISARGWLDATPVIRQVVAMARRIRNAFARR